MSASEATYWLREFLGESLSPMDVFIWIPQLQVYAFDLGREVRENLIQSDGAQVAGPSSGTQHEEHFDLFKRGFHNCVLKSFADVSFDA